MDLGDVNGDGATDVVFANFGRNRVCVGNGVGGFDCSDVSAAEQISSSVALGDLNGDDRLDADFAETRNGPTRTSVCLGNGSGGFTCSDEVVSQHSLDVGIGDVNNDGSTPSSPRTSVSATGWAGWPVRPTSTEPKTSDDSISATSTVTPTWMWSLPTRADPTGCVSVTERDTSRVATSARTTTALER